MVRIPGLIDPHVHIREPGGTHKEDWDTGTTAALAGGFTTILAMPNTHPPVTDRRSLQVALTAARTKARCDYAQFVGAGPDNLDQAGKIGSQTAGLKLYLDQTYGPLRLDDMALWIEHFKHWPKHLPIVAHAEGRTMAAVILMAAMFNRTLHLAHVSLREEILLIRMAKEKGIQVTCEVAPHHLFLTTDDIPSLGSGKSEVRPRLASPRDQAALWTNLEVIDAFATDHAPHTLEEKMGENSPPGFPGLETALPLLLTAVYEGRLTLDGIVQRMVTNPRKIFSIPDQPDTWVELDLKDRWEIHASDKHTRCHWTPFEGRSVVGRVRQVYLRGSLAFDLGMILAAPGSGKNIRQLSNN
jgi:carbamoyl-phosphate synthase / aspartate carbamoyltransferase / dihydroorotase